MPEGQPIRSGFRPSTLSDVRLAVHEAGHAVVAVALGLEDVRTGIRPASGSALAAMVTDRGMQLSATDYLAPMTSAPDAAPRMGIVAAAGMAASSMCGDPDPHEIGRLDERKMLALARLLEADPAERANLWYRDAREILDARQDELEAVSYVLAGLRPRLDAAELLEVLGLVRGQRRRLAAGIIGNPAIQKMDLVRVEDPVSGIAQNFIIDTYRSLMTADGTFLGTVALIRGGVANEVITEDPPATELVAPSFIQTKLGSVTLVMDHPVTDGHTLTCWSVSRVGAPPTPSGFTPRATAHLSIDAGGHEVWAALFTKTAAGESGSFGVGGSVGAFIIETDGTFGAVLSQDDVHSDTLTCGGALTPSGGNAIVLGCAAIGTFWGASVAPDTGVTELVDVGQSSPPDAPTIWVGYEIVETPGATTIGGAISSVPGATVWGGVTYSILP